jgi:hypothetical protein
MVAAEYLATRFPPGSPTSARTSSCTPSRPTTQPSGSTSTHALAPPSLSQTTSPSHGTPWYGTTPTRITLFPRRRPKHRPLPSRPSHSSGLRAHLNPSSSRTSRASARSPTTTTRRTRSRSPRRFSSALRMGRFLASCGTRGRNRRTACLPSTRSMIDAELVRCPSPVDSSSAHLTPNLSPKLGQKRRVSSLNSCCRL